MTIVPTSVMATDSVDANSRTAIPWEQSPTMDLYEAYVSKDGVAWMLACHPQEDVVAKVASDLIMRLQQVRAMGPLYGQDPGQPIKKLEAFDNLWESRVRHKTGWYRQFFRITTIAGRSAVVFIDGAVKKGSNLPRHVLEAADRRLDAYSAKLQADPALREADRVKP